MKRNKIESISEGENHCEWTRRKSDEIKDQKKKKRKERKKKRKMRKLVEKKTLSGKKGEGSLATN